MGPYSASARQVMLGMGLSKHDLAKKRVAKRSATPKKTRIRRTGRTVKSSSGLRESAELPAPPASRVARK